MHLLMHTALPLSVILRLDRVMLEAERPKVLRLVGIRLPTENAPWTQVVHMPRTERDFHPTSWPLAGIVVTGHDLVTAVFRSLPLLGNQPSLSLRAFLPSEDLLAGVRVRVGTASASRALRPEVGVHGPSLCRRLRHMPFDRF